MTSDLQYVDRNFVDLGLTYSLSFALVLLCVILEFAGFNVLLAIIFISTR